ncbi:hypothetical protein Fmac_029643 [Flemingia macrophylla]|uniref:Uncharacterized protein n=1 Tax=Flemingia macrophylla TaxID=520843 RepID=A0ABD1LAY4_9FABA
MFKFCWREGTSEKAESLIELIILIMSCVISKLSETHTHIFNWKHSSIWLSLNTNLASVVFPKPPIPTMGITWRFLSSSLRFGSIKSSMIFSLSCSLPITSESATRECVSLVCTTRVSTSIV